MLEKEIRKDTDSVMDEKLVTDMTAATKRKANTGPTVCKNNRVYLRWSMAIMYVLCKGVLNL